MSDPSTLMDTPTWITPPRRDHPELLDMGYGSPDDVRESLRDVWRVNTWLGGIWSLARLLSPRLAQHPYAAVVDLGAGTAQIAGWFAQRHPQATVIPLDFSRRNITSAELTLNMHLLQSDALRLPFAPNSVDYVMSSLFLHHFTPQQVICILRESFKVARYGVIMSDLMRGRFNELAWHVARPVFARHHITYHDGLVSVQRAYTPTEMLRFAVAAGIDNAQVYTPFPWRMILVMDKKSILTLNSSPKRRRTSPLPTGKRGVGE